MPLSILENVLPSDFGFDPIQYPSYRKHPQTGADVQLEVVEFCAYTDKRFAVASAPVGIGKMLIAATLMKLTGLRTCVLAPYKGLQDQYAKELAGHLLDVRGRGNYPCAGFENLDCRGGVSMGCKYAQGNGCTYERVRDEARVAAGVVTNYDFWLAANDHAGGINRQGEDAEINGANPIELLILDEASLAEGKLSEYLATRIYEKEISRWVDPREMGEGIGQWSGFVKSHMEDLKAEIRTTQMELQHMGKKARKEHVDVLHGLERLLQKFERISGMKEDWVLERREGTKWGRMWAFDVVWPGRYAEQFLFCGVPKVVLLDGTSIARDMGGLGVRKEDFIYKQWGRIFPANRNPILICPPRKINAQGKSVGIGLRQGMSEQDKAAWMEWNDSLIDARLDRKGLFLTTSYEWQRYVLNNSRHADIMIGNNTGVDSNDPETASEAMERFIKMKAPAILVSPSFARGWDFKYDRAEYVIISKCPFVPRFGRVMEARLRRDPKCGDAATAKTIQQGAGRPMRAEDDRGEVLLTDGQFEFFVHRNAGLFQDWFVKACRKVVGLVEAPEKLMPKINP